MKKLLLIFFVSLLIISGNVKGQQINIGTPDVSVCGSVDVPVTVQNFTNVGTISLKLNYNSALLSYTGVELNPAINGALTGVTPGVFTLSYFGSNINLNGVALFTLQFDMAPAATGDAANFTWSAVQGDCELSGPGGTPVIVSTFNNLPWSLPERPVKNTVSLLEYCTIEDAVYAEETLDGHTITVDNGTYVMSSTLNIDKKLSIIGESEAGVVVDLSSVAGYGWAMSADNITLKNFTFLPNPGTGTYTLKTNPPTSTPLNNLTWENITINGSKKTPFDVHGYNNVTLTNLTAKNTISGVGVALSGCVGVTMTGITTENNAWGGIAVYVSTYVSRGTSNVTFDFNLNSVDEFLYIEDENGLVNSGITVSNWTFGINNKYGLDKNFTAYMKKQKADALALGAGLNTKFANKLSYVWDPAITTHHVGPGMSIQRAIDVALASSTYAIDVIAGTYEEQITVDAKPIAMVGAGAASTFINAPVSMAATFTTSYDAYPVVGVINDANLSMSGFTVDGLGRGNTNYKMMGVAFRNSGGLLNNCEILNIENTPFSGAQHGVGVYAYNDDDISRNITVTNNKIENFQKNAMALNASSTTAMVIDVSGNTIVGHGATDVTAQNGIQTNGALITGSVSENTISGIAYDNTAATTKWAATSILNYSNIDITSNTITGAHLGIYNIDATGTIAGNDLTIVKVGVYAFGILGTDPPKAVPQPYEEVTESSLKSANTTSATVLTVAINNNTVVFSGVDNTSTYGIEVDAGYGADDLNVSGIGNIVEGFEVGFEVYQCQTSCSTGVFTGVSFNNNQILNNTIGVRSNVNYLIVNATCNWYGTTNYNNIFPLIVGNVNFVPYLTTDNIQTPLCNGTVPPVHNLTQNIYYNTIQLAVNDAHTADVIEASAGNYSELVTVPVSVTIKSATPGGAILNGAFHLSTNNAVTVDGFTINNGGSMFGGTKGAFIVSGDGHIIQNNVLEGDGTSGYYGIHVAAGNYDNLTITGNEFTGWIGGIYLNPSSGHSISGNKFYDNVLAGIASDGISNTSITNNEFTGHDDLTWGEGIGTGNVGVNVLINNNKFSGNTYGVRHYGGGANVNATHNWWGNATGPFNDPENLCGLGNKVSANVTFRPWWTNEAMNILSTAPTGPSVTVPATSSSITECVASATAPTVFPVVEDFCGTVLSPTQDSPLRTELITNCEGTVSYAYTYTDVLGASLVWTYTYTIDRTTAPVVPANASKTVACLSEAVQPTLLSPVVDQQQLQTYTGGNWRDCTSIGQSFTCGTSGWLTKLDLRVGSLSGTLNFTLEIYQGNGIGGTNIYSGSHSFSASGWQSLNIAQDVAPYLTAGVQYTFWLTSWSYQQVGLLCMNPNVYNGGVAMDGCTSGCSPTYAWQQWPTYDLVFKTYMTAVPIVKDVCGTVIPTPTPDESGTYNGCEGTKVYTYTYTDCAGKSTPWVFTYIIERNDFTMPANATSTVACVGDVIVPTPPAVNDNCGNPINPVAGTAPTAPACEGEMVYSWTYTDCESTSHVWTHTVIIDDNIDPVITCPEPVTFNVNSGCNYSGPIGALATATDNCDGTVGISNNYTGSLPAGVHTVTWTASDCAGNTSTCTQIVTVVKNTLSGTLTYNNNVQSPMANVLLKLFNSSSIQVGGDVVTSEANPGYFEFTNLCADEYTIVASDTSKVGYINATDAGAANYWGVHGGDIEYVKFLSGDVTEDLYISSPDALAIQNYFVFGTAFTRDVWSFWLQNTIVHNNDNPYTLTPSNTHPTAMKIVVSGGDVTKNILAMATGDFNGSFGPTLKSASSELALINENSLNVKENQIFELPLRAQNAMEVGAVSMILSLPTDLVQVTGVKIIGSEVPVSWAMKGNELRIGWNSLDPVLVGANGALVNLQMRASDNFSMGQTMDLGMVINPLNELANGNFEVIRNATLVAAKVGNGLTGISGVMAGDDLLFSNYPNPFSRTTTLEYNIPVDGKVNICVYNQLGQLVNMVIDENQAAGRYSIRDCGSNLVPGVYIAKLRLTNSTTEMVGTIKLNVLK